MKKELDPDPEPEDENGQPSDDGDALPDERDSSETGWVAVRKPFRPFGT
jgi:hypothetical protein